MGAGFYLQSSSYIRKRPWRSPAVSISGIVLTLAFVAFATSAAAQSAQEKFSLDKKHTYVGFEVSYFLLMRIQGQFHDFEGTFVIDRERPENNRADIVIKTTSIDAGSESRNSEIRGPSLFDADKYPEMVFHSDTIELKPDNTGIITGDLTLRGITKRVTLSLTRIPDVRTREAGDDKSFSDGFVVTGEIKRSDFNMNDYTEPIGDVVTLFVCYKLDKCNSTLTQQEEPEPRYNE